MPIKRVLNCLTGGSLSGLHCIGTVHCTVVLATFHISFQKVFAFVKGKNFFDPETGNWESRAMSSGSMFFIVAAVCCHFILGPDSVSASVVARRPPIKVLPNKPVAGIPECEEEDVKTCVRANVNLKYLLSSKTLEIPGFENVLFNRVSRDYESENEYGTATFERDNGDEAVFTFPIQVGHLFLKHP